MAKGTIYVTNSGSYDLFVTLTDRNTATGTELWTNERLNEDEARSVLCDLDGGGDASIDWVARATDDSSITSSGSEKIAEGATLEVFAS